MTAKGKLVGVLQKVLPDDINAEISVLIESTRETRIRNNSIAEGTDKLQISVRVRAEQGGRVGIFCTNRLNIPGLRKALVKARENAAFGRPGPLILTGSTGYREMVLIHPGTAGQSAKARGETLAPLVTVAGSAGIKVNGALTASVGEFVIANTAGLAASTRVSAALFNASVASGEGSGVGYGFACDRDADKLDVMGSFLQAAAKCQASQYPQLLPAGEYTVILEPAAVADLMAVVARTVFNGRTFLEGCSPLAKIGTKIFGDNITIWDDGLDMRGMAVPFDFQGVPKQRLFLVTRGVAQNLALDNETATRLNMAGTGHASLPGANLGPMPAHIFLEPGNAMLDDMIASTKRGILISRLRNVAVLDPKSGMFTGATGNGTLLIENGQLAAALPNLRFVQNLIQALNRVEMTGDEARLFGGLWGSLRVPALKIQGFSIIGSNFGQI